MILGFVTLKQLENSQGGKGRGKKEVKRIIHGLCMILLGVGRMLLSMPRSVSYGVDSPWEDTGDTLPAHQSSHVIHDGISIPQGITG